MDKSHILSEIRRIARENGGSTPGRQRFESETRIRAHEWLRHWARWGDAVREAGLDKNDWIQRTSDSEILEKVSALVRELGKFPVTRELGLKAARDPTFPSPSVFRRFGGQRALATRVRDHSIARGYEDVAGLCGPVANQTEAPDVASSERSVVTTGAVYLIKSGRFYKIGRSNAVGRRERELDIALPQAVKLIHSIKTDDPVGIEDYWHRRFGDRRAKGEWFELESTDIAAFKRRKFM